MFSCEILEKIFEYADLPTLKVCSLANKCFFDISRRFIEKRAWAKLPVEDVNRNRPLRRYLKVRLCKDLETSALDFFDPTPERITHLELSNAVLFERALLYNLKKRPAVHTLIMKGITIVEAKERKDAYVIHTVKHLTAIQTDYISVNFRNIETLVFIVGEKSFNQANLFEVLSQNNETLKSITLDLADGYDLDPPGYHQFLMEDCFDWDPPAFQIHREDRLEGNHLRNFRLAELQEAIQQYEVDGNIDMLLDGEFFGPRAMSIDLCRLECLELRGLRAYLKVLRCFKQMTNLRRVNLVDITSIITFDEKKFENVEEIWVAYTYRCCIKLDEEQWAYHSLGQTHQRFNGFYKRLRSADVQISP